MNFFVTGVGGQLGHDVMNELLKRGHEGVGSDIQETYSGVADGSAVTKAPYVALDITDKEAVEKVITEVNPDAVIHCAAWTAVDMAEDDDKVAKVRAINAGGTQNIADKVIIVQHIHGLLPTTAGKRIEDTVGHQFPEADADIIYVQFFQKRIRHLIGQTIHCFIQIVGGQLLCQFHQGSIHAVCLRQAVGVCQMV